MSSSDRLAIVTGADGFIGSHLCEALVADGWQVRALVWYNAFGQHGWLDHIPQEARLNIDVVLGDIRDAHAMIDFLRPEERAHQTTLFHLASLIGVPYSYQAPSSYVDTNIGGTLNLLQAARQHQISRFVHVSTSEVYGSAQKVPMTETHPQSAQSPYAASKIAADQLALSFQATFDLPVTILRPFNTFGPRQSTRAVIPTIITQLMAGNTVTLGSVEPTRDFVFVRDTVAGLIAAAESPQVIGETVHIGSGVEISIGLLAERIASLMDQPLTIEQAENRVRPAESEVDRLLCDKAKAKRLLGWSPTVLLDDGLRQVIDWFSIDSNRAAYRSEGYAI